MVNPFDPKTALLAKHAQHVVLIHFPIALFISAVAFDFLATVDQAPRVGRYRLLQPDRSRLFQRLPVLTTGILAWRFQLEGQKLKGLLLFHLVLACVSTVMIWLCVVGAFPYAKARTGFAGLSPAAGSLRCRRNCADRTPGRLSQRSKRARLVECALQFIEVTCARRSSDILPLSALAVF